MGYLSPAVVLMWRCLDVSRGIKLLGCFWLSHCLVGHVEFGQHTRVYLVNRVCEMTAPLKARGY